MAVRFVAYRLQFAHVSCFCRCRHCRVSRPARLRGSIPAEFTELQRQRTGVFRRRGSQRRFVPRAFFLAFSAVPLVSDEANAYSGSSSVVSWLKAVQLKAHPAERRHPEWFGIPFQCLLLPPPRWIRRVRHRAVASDEQAAPAASSRPRRSNPCRSSRWSGEPSPRT